MKKSIKILALALTLALVCGVFVIGALAADVPVNDSGYDYASRTPAAGETVYMYLNYESTDIAIASYETGNYSADTTVPLYSIKSAGPYNLGAPAVLKVTSNTAVASVVKSPYENNKYFTYTATTVGGGPYMALGFATPGTTINDAQHVTTENTKYLVADFDFMVEGVLGRYPTFQFNFRKKDATGTQAFARGGGTESGTGTSVGIQLDWKSETNDQLFVMRQNTNGWANQIDLPTGNWLHVTYVLELIDHVCSDSCANDCSQAGFKGLNLYYFVDGVLMGAELDQWKWNPTTLDPETSYDWDGDGVGDPEVIYLVDYRINFQGSAPGNGTMSYDNIAIRRFDHTYDDTSFKAVLNQGKGADLTKWSENVYSAEDMPFASLVATVADAEGVETYYDNAQKAFDAAVAGDVITLHANATANVATAGLNIVTNGYTFDYTYDEGIAVGDPDGDGTYETVAAGEYLEVTFLECDCGCIKETIVSVPIWGNIIDAYTAQVGKPPVCSYIDPDTGALVQSVGWVDEEGLIEELTAETTVSEDMLGQYATVSYVYEEVECTAYIVHSNGSITLVNETNLETLLENNIATGDTVVLMQDFELVNDNLGTSSASSNTIQINKSITLDLNGHRVVTFVPQPSTADGGSGNNAHYKYSTFTVGSGITFNVTSSRAGAAVYNTMINGNSYNAAQGDPIFSASTGSVVNIDGADADGNTTVRMYCAVLYMNYGNNNCTLNIDGGEYYRTASDSWALIYARNQVNATIKNALLYGGARTLGWFGADNAASTLTVDNCILLGTAVMEYEFDALTATITNSYIAGKLDPDAGTFSGATNTKGTYNVTVGEGCYFAEGVTAQNFNLAKGMKTYDVALTKDYVETLNTFTKDLELTEDDLALTSTAKTLALDKVVASETLVPTTVSWYDVDGTTLLATSEALALPGGSKATVPTELAFEVEGTDGWVKALYSSWSDDAFVPYGAETASFTLLNKEDVTYIAGKIDVKYSVTLVNHLQANFFVPMAAEGITVTGVAYGGAFSGTGSVSGNLATDSEGKVYGTYNRYPGAANAAKTGTITVNYNYNGTDLSYTTVGVSVTAYAAYLMENNPTAEIKTLAAAMVKYVEAAVNAANGTTNESLTNAVALANEYALDSTIDATATNEAAKALLAEYVDQLVWSYSSMFNGFTATVTPKEGYAVFLTTKDQTGLDNISEMRTTDNCATMSAHNVRTAAMARTLILSVYKTEDVSLSGQVVKINSGAAPVASAEYSFAGYVNDNAVADVEIVDAVLAYANAIDAYYAWAKANGIVLSGW